MGTISRITERVRALLTDHGNVAFKKCFYGSAKLLSGVPQTPVIPADIGIQDFKSRGNSNTPWVPKLLLQSLLSFIVTSVFVLPSVAATSPVGATQGQFQVSESGAANYSIPISLPPGTAGMQPSLSLSYNSQGGNGLLGMGWSLGGLSSISRCPQTQAQDGVRGAVNFDANDRFCLDGQRLMVISGVYCAAGAEYRTERESYSRIISYGTAGNGPAYFKVWTKSGQVMEYGVTADSQIEAQGKASVFVWALNKVQDTVGNYLTVTYLEDNANGQFYPARIDYTGNAGNGLVPYNSVQFTYETRPDIVPMFHAGSLMKTTVRMSKVQSYAAAALSREYRLTYNLSTTTQRSQIATMTECAGDGVCLPATAFTWNDFTPGFNTPEQWADVSQLPSIWQFDLADVTGDGKADAIILDDSIDSYVAKSLGTQFEQLTKWADWWSGPSRYNGQDNFYFYHRYVDFNGDGVVDVGQFSKVVAYGTSIGISSGSGFGISPYNFLYTTYIDQNQFADFDGDGRADVAAVYLPWDGSEKSVKIGIMDGTYYPYAAVTWASVPGAQAGAQVQYPDLNGDGRADLVYQTTDNKFYVGLSTGSGFQNQTLWAQMTGSFASTQFADVNGDGLADLLFQDSANAIWVGFSTGTGFTTPVKWAQVSTLC